MPIVLNLSLEELHSQPGDVLYVVKEENRICSMYVLPPNDPRLLNLLQTDEIKVQYVIIICYYNIIEGSQ